MENTLNLTKLLNYIDPSSLDYSEWIIIGMALKHEGYSVDVWDDWSGRDAKRYHPNECYKKWNTFDKNGAITGATITQMAKEGGWLPVSKAIDKPLEWDDEISADDYTIIDTNWIEGKEIEEPDDEQYDGVKDLIKYLETLFEASENVGYVTRAWETDGRWLPTKGAWDRTAGKLIEELNKCNGDIGAVLGDYNQQAGAWIRFNPLDGKGIKNENVSDFRYALVESDTMEIDKQNSIMRELELPIACLVHSGKKSLHAIVKIDAINYEEYRKRVDFLYEICKKNGLEIDKQNRNPSRLSRMPGIIRNGKKQYLIDTNIGKQSFEEWKEWIDGINDDLPEPESLTEFWNYLPELSPPLIHGLLRQGHKMLMAGPSKAGKSYSLIELCIAIAEGKKWLNWDCAKGKILYVNLELDRASCFHRFKDVYEALQIRPENLNNIDIWNLRGKSVPMDKLAPKLIRRAQKKDYIAIIIDPIYKVITGDENSADQMAHFCNQFDKVCTDLGAAVIYCHHHSKGYQGSKRSMDRASGSGVFARDPDALIDLVELEMTEELKEQRVKRAESETINDYIVKKQPNYAKEHISIDDTLSVFQMREHVKKCLSEKEKTELNIILDETIKKIKVTTAWRIEGTLREFPKFEPVNIYFDYPVHKIDSTGVLADISPGSDKPIWQKGIEKRKTKEKKQEERVNKLEIAFSNLELEGKEHISIKELAEEMKVSERTIYNRIKEHGEFEVYKIENEKKSFLKRKQL